MIFCPAIAQILQHTYEQQRKSRKPKFRESLSLDDIAKSHSYLTSCKTWIFQTFSARCTLVSGQLNYRVPHLNASNWLFESQSALKFSKILFQVYVTTIVPCSKCDFAMSSIERDSLNFGFPYLLCYGLLPVCMLQYLSNGWTEFDENFTPGVKSPVDSNYDVRIDV